YEFDKLHVFIIRALATLIDTLSLHDALPISLNEQQVQDLTLEVRIIFAHNCNNCHGEAKKKGGLRLDSREAIFAGGESGPILVPGQSGKTELIRRVTLPAGHKDVMPSKGKLLNTQQM